MLKADRRDPYLVLGIASSPPKGGRGLRSSEASVRPDATQENLRRRESHSEPVDIPMRMGLKVRRHCRLSARIVSPADD